MKLSKILILVAATMLFAFASCKSSKKMTSDPAKIYTQSRGIVDYQGSEFGILPNWVVTLNQGSVKNVAKELGIDTKTDMIFVAQGKNKDLELAEVWVKNINAKQEIAAAISQVIASDAEAEMEAKEGKDLDEPTKDKLYKSATAMASAITLNGLEKVADFWIRAGNIRQGVNTKKKDLTVHDFEDLTYTYYVVYKMTIADFRTQVNAAMTGVKSNTSEQDYLKKVLAEKIGQAIYPGNTVPHN